MRIFHLTINQLIVHILYQIHKGYFCVIYHCKSIKRKDQDSTWIDEDMVRAYTKLHTQGVVKSVEVYQDSKLVGGLARLCLNF
jgi:leucyl/phenylalanyl-tRNA--protein transferase